MVSKAPALFRHSITTTATVVKPEALAVLNQKLELNMWAQPSRKSPNGALLKDGAIQRQSVSTMGEELRFVKANPDGVGFYKREELNRKAEKGSFYWSDPRQTQEQRYKIARIYMSQLKHLHCHPTNKTDGHGWTIDFGSWGNHKSPLMGWSTGTMDSFNDIKMSFGRLNDAIQYAEAMGWGYDVTHPNYRWHTKKDYSSNFAWKGPPKPVVDYD
jgi:hypothetical protein